MCPIPCRGEDGKVPNAYRWGTWKNRPGAKFLAKMIEDHPDANLGILTGPLSGVTIIDVDDANLVPLMLDRFGDTPLVTRTPSGGVHLWYQWNGEGCPTHLRRLEGLPVDVKGKGGFTVEPPSFRPSDMAPYRFEKGSLDDLSRLPMLRANGLGQKLDKSVAKSSKSVETNFIQQPLDNSDVGTRDINLFDFARSITPDHYPHDKDGLKASVLAHNAAFNPPLPESQAVQKAYQAWKYADCLTSAPMEQTSRIA